MVIVAPGLDKGSDMNAKRDSSIHFTSNRTTSNAAGAKSIKDDDHAISNKTRTGPHTVVVTKSETGFGFNVRGQIGEGGPMKSINGELYAPLQHVSAVLEGGAAEQAGLRKGDRILEVNGVSVEGATHKQVVDLIRSGGHVLTLTVITVTHEDAERLEPQEESTNFAIDYTERRSLPISIPEYKLIEKNGEKFAVFCIHMAGRHLCSRRYKQFDELHNSLKREFYDFPYPKFPSKWPFSLSEQQTDARRRKLEQWLERVCSVRVIADSDIMQDFLNSPESGGVKSDTVTDVEIKILLPDKSTVTLTIDKTACTPVVYRMTATAVRLPEELLPHFALFELVEYSFERKLRDDERPHEIYIHNYTTATNTCISFGKWVFNPQTELRLTERHEIALNYFFWQAVDEVNRGHIRSGTRLHELKALQDAAKKIEYLALCRALPGYGSFSFPPCSSDARKGSPVIPIVLLSKFKLQACTADGTPESQEIDFEWKDITKWQIERGGNEDEQPFFSFDYARPQRPVRTVKIYTPFFLFLNECFDKVKIEREGIVET
ncbi:sorting nexin-27-like [Paramacrobiotus metropolitanus]|uniref:sorting nexin-27-like n=1 Tax=Paramacrobiotus metropolitanus TaxID=2943436 RepID=UPI002445CCBA|nr:sorting nexin-27-like [Paramacrobiotus metropolitanus]